MIRIHVKAAFPHGGQARETVALDLGEADLLEGALLGQRDVGLHREVGVDETAVVVFRAVVLHRPPRRFSS